MKDIGEHKNLGVGVVGNLKKTYDGEEPSSSYIDPDIDLKVEEITEEKLKEGTVNKG